MCTDLPYKLKKDTRDRGLTATAKEEVLCVKNKIIRIFGGTIFYATVQFYHLTDSSDVRTITDVIIL